MASILFGTLLFATVLGFTNLVLIKRFKILYSSHIWVFAAIYLLAFLLIFTLFSELSIYFKKDYSLLIPATTAATFVLQGWWWQKRVDFKKCYGYKTIPNDFENILFISVLRNIAKLFEIVFQQLCALLILTGLLEFGLGLLPMMTLFAGVTFLVHITSPKWFGKVYGNYFLWMATLLAPLEVYLILEYVTGFYLAVSLHISMYVLMYSLAYVLSDKRV